MTTDNTAAAIGRAVADYARQIDQIPPEDADQAAADIASRTAGYLGAGLIDKAEAARQAADAANERMEATE